MRKEMISQGPIEQKILMIRGQKVMLDADLAELYGVSTKRLNQQVRRNLERFPADFMFQLTIEESSALRLQIATSKKGRGGRRYTPYAFTEHGAIMAASVLNTKRAIEMSVFVVRAFVKLREILRAHKDLAYKLTELERKVGTHDESIRRLVTAIRRLMAPLPAPPEAEPQKSAFRTTFYSPAKAVGHPWNYQEVAVLRRRWRAGRKRIGFVKERKGRYLARVRGKGKRWP